MERKIISTLEKIRPFIQRDGGDVEFVRLEDDGTVYVKMHGACVGCGMLDTTLNDGIKEILMDEVPGVTEVKIEEI